MALDMRALYYVALPTERSEADDVQRHEEDIKANENCLNQNDYFSPRINYKYIFIQGKSNCFIPLSTTRTAYGLARYNEIHH